VLGSPDRRVVDRELRPIPQRDPCLVSHLNANGEVGKDRGHSLDDDVLALPSDIGVKVDQIVVVDAYVWATPGLNIPAGLHKAAGREPRSDAKARNCLKNLPNEPVQQDMLQELLRRSPLANARNAVAVSEKRERMISLKRLHQA
jgi:hypothetical protein